MILRLKRTLKILDVVSTKAKTLVAALYYNI